MLGTALCELLYVVIKLPQTDVDILSDLLAFGFRHYFGLNILALSKASEMSFFGYPVKETFGDNFRLYL